MFRMSEKTGDSIVGLEQEVLDDSVGLQTQSTNDLIVADDVAGETQISQSKSSVEKELYIVSTFILWAFQYIVLNMSS